jgi:heme exporter protein CcmD
MMDLAGAHISFVIASYGATLAGLALLALAILLRDRRLRHELARLESTKSHDG